MKRVEMRMNQELGKKLLSILKEEQVKKDEPMKSHTITKFSIDKAKLKIPAFFRKILHMRKFYDTLYAPYPQEGTGQERTDTMV